MRRILTALLTFVVFVAAWAAGPETYVFGVQEGDTLRLDRYPARGTATGQTLLFAFGGGFTGGARDQKAYLPFFNTLTAHGINVVSTDYRTTLGKKPIQPTAEGFTQSLVQAVMTAVADYYSATAFVASHSAQWGCDPAKIVACGSSAGAITVLEAEYGICTYQVPKGLLPAGFQYQGVVSMAGAIMSDGAPQWEEAPCPMLFFHGDADRRVPFGAVTVEGAGLYGSNAIVESLTTPYWMYTARGEGHELASTPLTQQAGVVLDFLKALNSGRPMKIVKMESRIPGQESYQTDFTLQDYIRANMPQPKK